MNKLCLLTRLLILSLLPLSSLSYEDTLEYKFFKDSSYYVIRESFLADDTIPFSDLPPNACDDIEFKINSSGPIKNITQATIYSRGQERNVESQFRSRRVAKDKWQLQIDYKNICKGDILSYTKRNNKDILPHPSFFTKLVSNISSPLNVKIESEFPISIYPHMKNYLVKKGDINQSSNEIEVTFYPEKDEESKEIFTIYRDLTWPEIISSPLIRYKSAIYHKRIYKEELPQELLTILDKSRKLTNEIEQIKYVIEEIILNYTPKFDDNERKGVTTFPQSFIKTIRNKNGDCKEIGVVIGAILQKIGYQVFALSGHTWDSKKQYPQTSKPSLLVLNNNHIMLYVISSQNKEYIIDPRVFIYHLKDQDGKKIISQVDLSLSFMGNLKRHSSYIGMIKEIANTALINLFIHYPHIFQPISLQTMIVLDKNGANGSKIIKVFKQNDTWFLDFINP